MDAARPSRTAYRVAFRRATHQLFDARPLVLDDPIAVPILGAEARAELQAAEAEIHQPGNLILRAWMVARSRYAEDCLAQAVAAGVRQYVLLGAGLDTFAHRNPHPQLRVFEVDHPATQAWKRQLVAAASLPQPTGLTYVPVNFECDSLETQLAAAGFDAAAPAFFAWLGVVPYLTLGAFRATLGFIAARPTDTGLVFDYTQPRTALSFRERMALDLLMARVARVGEPFQLFFTPAEMARELAEFYNLEDLGSGEINSRYFALRKDKLQCLGQSGRLVSAWL
jgi:methyltransferase (TIGR00027 family)